MTRYLDYPLHIDGRGRSAETDADDHIRDLIFQVLFTNPGERVNRPDFGCGIKQLVFAPNSDALAAATQTLIHGSLQRWLGTIIDVQQLTVEAREETLLVTIAYVNLRTGEQRLDVFTPVGVQLA